MNKIQASSGVIEASMSRWQVVYRTHRVILWLQVALFPYSKVAQANQTIEFEIFDETAGGHIS